MQVHFRDTARPGFLLSGLRVAALALALSASHATAAVSAAERQFLLDLYTSANGAGWTNSTNWNGAPGSECTWYGVVCDLAQTQVTEIVLVNNNLVGTLPANLNNLTGMTDFAVFGNQLTGSIPALAGLTSLSNFVAASNQLTGPIPSLAGLTNLSYFSVSDNQLTGSIPALAGLTNMWFFAAFGNQLTGPIPSLAGLTNLQAFNVGANQLSGSLPSVPSPTNSLVAGGSQLCPNNLSHTADAAWDAATGETPWYTNCGAPPVPPSGATGVPTLSEWGLMIMSLLLGAVGMTSGFGRRS